MNKLLLNSTVALTIFATRAVLAFETDPVRLAIWAVGGVFLAILLDAVPRVMVSLRPERSALVLLPAIEISARLLEPLIAGIEKSVIAPLRLVSKAPREAAWTAHEEIREAVDLLHREGGVVKDDRDMVGGVLDLSELPLSDIMIHRTKMRTFDVDMPVGDLLKAVIASPFTEMPAATAASRAADGWRPMLLSPSPDTSMTRRLAAKDEFSKR